MYEDFPAIQKRYIDLTNIFCYIISIHHTKQMKRFYFLEPFSDEFLLQSPREQAIRAYLRSKNVAELLSKMYFPDMDDK